MDCMVIKSFQGWTQFRCKYGSNLKGKGALEDEKQNKKEKVASSLRKKKIHKLISSGHILWDFLRREEKKLSQSWQHKKAVVLSTITSSPFNLFSFPSLGSVKICILLYFIYLLGTFPLYFCLKISYKTLGIVITC